MHSVLWFLVGWYAAALAWMCVTVLRGTTAPPSGFRDTAGFLGAWAASPVLVPLAFVRDVCRPRPAGD